MKDLQTVLDALKYGVRRLNMHGDAVLVMPLHEAIAIVKQMMQAEPVAWRVWSPDGTNVYQYTEDGDGEPLFAAPQAVPAGWIPVTERQPEPEVTVLCYGPNMIDTTLPWRIFTDWCGSKKDFGLGVTHWMPLPAAPKGAV